MPDQLPTKAISVAFLSAFKGIPKLGEFATNFGFFFGDKLSKQQFWKSQREKFLLEGAEEEEEEQQQLQLHVEWWVGEGGHGEERGRWGSGTSVRRKYYLSYLGQSYSLTRKAKRNEGTA